MSNLNAIDKMCREGGSPNVVGMFTPQTTPFVKNVVLFSLIPLKWVLYYRFKLMAPQVREKENLEPIISIVLHMFDEEEIQDSPPVGCKNNIKV